MRKIEQQMIDAVNKPNKTHWQAGNTTVTGRGHIKEIYLHGNHIATVTPFGNRGGLEGRSAVVVNEKTLCQWPTPTTCSRLRALGVKVQIKGGMPYLDGVAV